MNVPYFRPCIGEEEKQRVAAVLESGWLTSGKAVQEFEARFAEYIRAPFAVALNSCTAGLHLSLEALEIGPGDAVLTPTMTFGATAAVVRHLGARPILVDCDPDTLTIDAEAANAAIGGWRSDQTLKAVIAMHYGGQMADMERISKLARASGIQVIEDAAHALPASYRDSQGQWRGVGESATLTAFSFYANKCITTGEGGMVVCSDLQLADRVRTMSLHGLSKSAWTRFEAKGSWYYEIAAPGYKYNLTDLAAAIGIAQLKKADAFCESRTRIARRYSERFAPHADLLETPRLLPNRKSSWHIYALRLNLDRLGIDRARFIELMQARGVVCSVHWMPLHLHPYYRDRYGYRSTDFPVATAEWTRLVSLPIFPGMTEAELDHVCKTVIDVAVENRRSPVYFAGAAKSNYGASAGANLD